MIAIYMEYDAYIRFGEQFYISMCTILPFQALAL